MKLQIVNLAAKLCVTNKKQVCHKWKNSMSYYMFYRHTCCTSMYSTLLSMTRTMTSEIGQDSFVSLWFQMK